MSGIFLNFVVLEAPTFRSVDKTRGFLHRAELCSESRLATVDMPLIEGWRNQSAALDLRVGSTSSVMKTGRSLVKESYKRLT